MVVIKEEQLPDLRVELLLQHALQQVARHLHVLRAVLLPQHVRRPERHHQRVKLQLHQPGNQVVPVHQHARQVQTILHSLPDLRLQQEHREPGAAAVQVIVVEEVPEAAAALVAAVPEVAAAEEAEGDK